MSDNIISLILNIITLPFTFLFGSRENKQTIAPEIPEILDEENKYDKCKNYEYRIENGF